MKIAFKQSERSSELCGRSYRDSDNIVREWKNLTMIIFVHGFGEGSKNVEQLNNADSAGGFGFLE